MIKTITIRLQKDMWLFLKKASMDKEISMNQVILLALEALKKKNEKELT